MSTLIADVCKIAEVNPHPNADRLDVTVVKGWQIVSAKGLRAPGQLVVHIPPDALVPRYLAQKWEVEPYLSWQKRYANQEGNTDLDMGRVKVASLRGQMSYGFIVEAPEGAELGQNLANDLGLDKWEPILECKDGDAENPHHLFVKYTNIENARNFPEVIQPGEEVVVTEKIHGQNFRSGIIKDTYEDTEGTLMIGSHSVRRKIGSNSKFEIAFKQHPGLEPLLRRIYKEKNATSVMVFGEIYGQGIQDLHYGAKGEPEARMFDISVDGRYLGYDEFLALCESADIPTVPLLYRGPFDWETVKGLADGDTLIMQDSPHMREGVVFKPVVERQDPVLGRVILKFVSDSYLLRKGGTEDH